MADAPTVALLGTGTMGAGMARNIAQAGMPLRVWNRTRAKAEGLADVATVADSAADAVRGADVLVTMLFDADSVAAAIDEAGNALGPGTVWLQTTTVGVHGERQLAGVAGGLQVPYVDAPVLGTKQPAEKGALTVLASGPSATRPVLDPVLDAIGQRTMWLGEEAGLGTRLKLAANAWVLTAVDGIAQSIALAAALGVEPQHFLDAVRGGAMDAPYVQLKGAAMLSGDFEPAFGLSGAVKDARLIEAAAREAGLDPSLISAVKDHLARAEAAGFGDRDLSATYLAHDPGLTAAAAPE